MLTEITFLSIGTWLGNKILDKGFDSVYKKISSKNFNDKFYEKVNLASKILQLNHPDALGGNIEYFFKHEDVFNELIKLLFVKSKVDLKVVEDKFDITTLPDNFILEFIELLKIELYKDQLFNEILSNKEIYLICVGLSENIEYLKKYSSLSYDEIVNIKEILESKFQNDFSFSNFINKYKTCLVNNYSQLSFLGLGLDLNIKKGKRKKLEDLFVKPSFDVDEDNLRILQKVNPEFKNENGLSLDKIFNFEKHLVILGNPGSGKSILTKFISLKLIQKEKLVFENEAITISIPFRIELRKYHAFKKDKNEGIIKYIRFLLELEYGFSNMLAEDVETILLDKQSVVIFDGLDEIFDLNDKILIKNDIENFLELYSNTRAIITSRIIGYDDIAFKGSEILQLVINNFDEAQIEEYIKNWYLAEEEDDQIRHKEIEDFLKKKKLIDNELISNPLLLSLIVILYRNNLKVPESKLEIYQSCTKTLVDKWDHSKGIEINLPEEIYKRKDTVFADLAYWQYKELSKKDGKVTYQRAKNTVALSLTEKLLVVDDFTSDLYSEQFLLYAQKRSLYFDNNFTHKTFLEYFTAFWIFSNIEKKHKKSERNKLIKTYIVSSYWHIVLELLINLIDKDQADNEIIDDLIKYQLNKNANSSTFFLQIFNTIQNVSSSTFEDLVKQSIYGLLSDAKLNDHNDFFKNRQNSPFYILAKHYGNNSLKQLIEKCIREIACDDNIFKDDKLLLSLYLELIHENQKNEKLDFSKSEIETIALFSEKTKQGDPLNFIMIEFTFSREAFNLNPFLFASSFLKNFKNEVFTVGLRSKFSSFRYFPIQFICLKHLFFHSDHTLLNNYLTLIEKNDIKITDLLENCFINLFFFRETDDFDILMKNMNYITNKDFLILLVPVFYKLRFGDKYGRDKEFELDIADLLKLLEDEIFAQRLNFISNKRNSKTEVKNYIAKEFKIDKSIISKVLMVED